MLSFTLESFQRLPLWFQVLGIGFRSNTFIPVLSLSVNKLFNVAFLEDLAKFRGSEIWENPGDLCEPKRVMGQAQWLLAYSKGRRRPLWLPTSTLLLICYVALGMLLPSLSLLRLKKIPGNANFCGQPCWWFPNHFCTNLSIMQGTGRSDVWGRKSVSSQRNGVEALGKQQLVWILTNE